jgi:hypothetical protein
MTHFVYLDIKRQEETYSLQLTIRNGQTEVAGDDRSIPFNTEIEEIYEEWVKYSFPTAQLKSHSTFQKLKKCFNDWVDRTDFMYIDRSMRTHLDPRQELRVIIKTDDTLLQKIPWHVWNLFEDYPRAEIALSLLSYRKEFSYPRYRNQVRILCILGNNKGINIENDYQLWQKRGAFISCLAQKSWKDIKDSLSNQEGWDILFFAGHGEEDGKIKINEEESTTIEELKIPLKMAIERGLKIAIFNSCEGLTLAKELALINMPQVIFMREAIQDDVAQIFLQHFLESYSTEDSLYLAVRVARNKLLSDKRFISVGWLPVIFQNPACLEISPTWQDLQKLIETVPEEVKKIIQNVREGKWFRIEKTEKFTKSRKLDTVERELSNYEKIKIKKINCAQIKTYENIMDEILEQKSSQFNLKTKESTKLLEKYLIEIGQKLVLIFDNFDESILDLNEFCSLICQWKRKQDHSNKESWQKLNVIIAYSSQSPNSYKIRNHRLSKEIFKFDY